MTQKLFGPGRERNRYWLNKLVHIGNYKLNRYISVLFSDFAPQIMWEIRALYVVPWCESGWSGAQHYIYKYNKSVPAAIISEENTILVKWNCFNECHKYDRYLYKANAIVFTNSPAIMGDEFHLVGIDIVYATTFGYVIYFQADPLWLECGSAGIKIT